MYTVVWTKGFTKKYRSIAKSGRYNNLRDDLAEVILLLELGKNIPQKYRDHALSGSFLGYRELHVYPDLLLVYTKESEILVVTLLKISTHSELF